MVPLSIDIRDLTKYHGGTLAVDHLTLQVRRGEFFSILGPSGSGKTSTLRVLAGFEEPDAGEILIEGKSMRGVPPHLRPVNTVFQSYALFPHLSVYENVVFGLEMRRLPAGEARARVGRVLEMVKLTGKESRLPSQLSGGEQQRVALARALVNEPCVLLLDEPLGALDQRLRQEMQGELKTIQEQVGVTFLYVTHHQEEALSMSDRLAVMDRGRLLQVGTPQDIYENPTSLFVAQFVGVSNQLTVRVESLDGRLARGRAVDCPDLPVLCTRSSEGLVVGTEVTLVLRPEQVRLSRDAHASGFDNMVPARIEKAIYSGNEMHYLLRLSDRVAWKARVPNTGADQKRFEAGEAVVVLWNADEAKGLPA